MGVLGGGGRVGGMAMGEGRVAMGGGGRGWGVGWGWGRVSVGSLIGVSDRGVIETREL